MRGLALALVGWMGLLLVPFGSSGCGALESRPDVWPGAWPDERRGIVHPDASPGVTVDVLTFNIKFEDPNDDENAWSERRAMVADLVHEGEHDVVGVQEALGSQLDYLANTGAYAQLGVGRDDGKSAGEHAAIFYRTARFAARGEGTFWLSPTPDVPGSKGWGNRLPRICTWVHLVERTTGRAFYVFNTHFDNQSQDSRALGVEIIAQRIAARSTPDPVIVMGDFNATEDNPALQYLRGAIDRASPGITPVPPSPRLVDTFRAAHPNAAEIGTFHRWTGRTSGRKIDFIFAPAPPAAEVLDAAILHARRGGKHPSDHFPVRARIRLAMP